MEIKILFSALILGLLLSTTKAQNLPVNKNASKPTVDIYNYIWNLSYGDSIGVIAGQNCGHGNELINFGFDKYIENLATETGKYVGMISLDYEFMKVYSIDELKATNKKLIEYWNAGGLVTLNYSPLNILDNNAPAMSPGGAGDMYRILPGGDLRNAWIERIDRIAEALKDLQNNGVTVLWRPMQEPNGPLFWYATAPFHEGGQEPEDYIALYRDMYDYFTNAKGLNNLLWVFAPTGTSSWSAFPYPGDDVVDIVGGTKYGNSLYISQKDYNMYNKPIAMSEFGWDTENTIEQDNMLYRQRLAIENPQFAYWVSWSDWSNIKMSIIANKNETDLLNHKDIITRDELPNFIIYDTIAPAAPAELTVSKLTDDKFTLSWTPSEDNVGIVAYKVFKDGSSVGTTSAPSIKIIGLTKSTTYAMAIIAADAAGNVSDTSAIFPVTTDSVPDQTAPTVPANLNAYDITTNSFKISWDESTDNIEVTAYKVYKNGVFVTETPTTDLKLANLSQSTTYNITIKAKDEKGNLSEASEVLIVQTKAISGTNISHKKSVTVSSTTGSYKASNAVDGDPYTRWESKWTDNEWIYIDLGAFYNITKVVLNWEVAYAKKYKIQISAEAQKWLNIYTTDNSAGKIEDLDIIGTGKFIRILMEKRATNYGNSLWEIEVYGKASTDTVASSPIDSLTSIKLPENDNQFLQHIQIYPNPVTGNTLTIALSNFNIGKISIYSLTGQKIADELIYSNELNNNVININLENNLKGYYLIKVETDTYSETSKIIVI